MKRLNWSRPPCNRRSGLPGVFPEAHSRQELAQEGTGLVRQHRVVDEVHAGMQGRDLPAVALLHDNGRPPSVHDDRAAGAADRASVPGLPISVAAPLAGETRQDVRARSTAVKNPNLFAETGQLHLFLEPQTELY